MITRNRRSRTISTLAVMLGVFAAFSGSLQAALLVYEPFDYDPAVFTMVNGTPVNAGTGLTGTWTGPSNANSRFSTPNLSYGILPVAGIRLHFVLNTNPWAQASIDPQVMSGRLDDGDVLWFSVLGYNANTTNSNTIRFKVGTDTNNALGFIMDRPGGSDTEVRIRAASWVAGTEMIGTGEVIRPTATPLPDGTHLVVGKMRFGGNDALEIYVPEKDLILPAAPASTISASLDQSTFGMIRFQITNGNTMYGDEVRIGTTYEDVVGLHPTQAKNPAPADKATDVLRDVVLAWTPGEYAATHDVYFGTTFTDVNDASRTSPLNVLASQGQDATTYTLGRLEFGTTYYWRIDEVNAPPDSTIFKGETWSLTTEPIAYPVAGTSIKASASSSEPNQGPENTINGSGMTGDVHSDVLTAMWLTTPGAAGPAWIQYEFDKVLRLHEMWVWNHNGLFEPTVGFGAKEIIIEYSTDGNDFTVLGTTHQFARATGRTDYTSNTIVDLGGITAKYIKLTIHSNWGGILKQYGLSEVRFYSVPVFAREPNPTSAKTGVDVTSSLSWRAGREAGQHKVSLSTDEQAVTDGSAPATTVTSPSYTSTLNLASTYYWRVDEVNEARTPSVWPGDLWSFSTQEFLVVDDFESYTNNSPNRVFQAWIDGAGFSPDEFFPQGNNGNGSGALVGYDPTLGPIMETKAVHGGKQSMPLAYDNTNATYSEAARTFESPQNWTLHGIKGLTLRFYGDPNNVVQQMYVKINSTKIPYDGDALNLKLAGWKMWYIDLTSSSVSNITKLSIGFDRLGGVGGQGKVFIDDIRLYSYGRELITPVAPDASGLQAQYKFEGNTNDSVGTRHLTVTGAPQYVAGKVGQAILLNGTGDFATVESSFDLPVYSAAMWFRVDGGTGARDILSIYNSAGGFGISAEIGSNGTFRFLHRFPFGSSGGTNISSTFTCADGTWYHAAIVKSPDTMTLYINGMPAGSAANTTQFDTALARLTIGVLKHDSLSRYFPGAIDEVHLYNRVLSAADIAGLAGLTTPYDESF